MRRPAELCVYRKRVEGLIKGCPIDPCHALKKFCNLVFGGHLAASFVDRVEQRKMDLIEHTEYLCGVENLRVEGPALVEHGRHSRDDDVLGLLFRPALEDGLKRVAVRAAIPEQLDHLGLPVRDTRRHLTDARRDLGEVLARLEVGCHY